MGASDSHADTNKKSAPEAQTDSVRRQAEAASRRDSASVSPEHRGDLLAKSRPDTASKFLGPMEFDHGHPATDQTNSPNLKRNPDGGSTETTIGSQGTRETTKNKFGETTHSKLTRNDGSTSELETGPNGEVTTTDKTPDGSYTKNIIGTDTTVIHHKVDGKGGFTDTTEKGDTKKVHEQKPGGEYTESNYRRGALENQSRHAADGSTLPPEAAEPVPKPSGRPVDAPKDPVGFGASEVDKIGRDLADKSKTTSFYRNAVRIAAGAVGVAAKVVDDAPPALLKAGKLTAAIAESPITKGVSPLLSPVLNGVLAVGGIMKEASGNQEGRHDIARAAVSWGVGGGVGTLAAGTGPIDPLIAGAAGIGAGQAYDALKDGKPITYDEAKAKHDSSWFYKIMEPNENNWAN
jgi:hypothetical protein